MTYAGQYREAPWYAPTTPLKECLATTQDSMVFCSNGCMTNGASCAC